MSRLHSRRLAGLLAAALALLPAWLPAAQDPVPGHAVTEDGRHTLNLKDADLQALVATVSEITGRNFILGPEVGGKVTVISARPMRADEIYDVFLSVLRVHGLAAVPAGSMVKIVPEAVAQQDAAPLQPGRTAAADEMVTRVVPVRHVAANDLIPVLRPLLPQGAQLVAHSGSNSLLVSDRAGNVQRLVGIIERIDTAADAQVEVLPLVHANAAELARTLTLLAEDKAAQASGEAARVFADTRTNSILLSGAPSARLRLRALVAHLDAPVDSGGDTQVLYLRYATASDLVPILQGIVQASGGSAAGGEGEGQTAANIQAHAETNALVISAPPAVFRSLATVVRQLDIRRNQVLIEAVVAEVSEETAREIGVQWQAPLRQDGRSAVIGGTNFTGRNPGNNILSAMQNPLGVGNGLNLGYIDGTVQFGRDSIFRLGALVTALRGDGHSNILSTPSVLTLDNQEAEIKVAQEVPFLTGQYTTASTTSVNTGGNPISNPFQTIERKDVGLVLKVKPQINEGESVRLDIHQEVSSLAPPVSGAVDLVTNKRELSTSVLVSDGALLVLGGLIDSQARDNVQKVPALGDIPLLGNLFRYRTNTQVQSDLMVFLRPQILRDAATEAAVSSAKYNYMRTGQLQMRQQDWPLTPRGERPLLPEMQDFLATPPPALPAARGR